jgi:hypothetical protein
MFQGVDSREWISRLSLHWRISANSLAARKSMIDVCPATDKRPHCPLICVTARSIRQQLANTCGETNVTYHSEW